MERPARPPRFPGLWRPFCSALGPCCAAHTLLLLDAFSHLLMAVPPSAPARRPFAQTWLAPIATLRPPWPGCAPEAAWARQHYPQKDREGEGEAELNFSCAFFAKRFFFWRKLYGGPPHQKTPGAVRPHTRPPFLPAGAVGRRSQRQHNAGPKASSFLHFCRPHFRPGLAAAKFWTDRGGHASGAASLSKI